MAGETRKKILEVTEKLIRAKGMARVTTKEIARELGMSEGALYRHFAHKEEVFFELPARYLPAFLDTLKAHAPGTGNVRQNLEAIALAAIHYYAHLIPMGASFLADTELLALYRKAFQQMNVGPHKFFEVVAAYLEEEQQLGRIEKHISALDLSILFLGPCYQYEFLRQFTGADPFDKSEREFVHMVVQGLASGHFLSQ